MRLDTRKSGLGLPRPRDRIVVCPFNPEWAELFAQEVARVRTALGQFIVETQHVGSTSIPGMDAKPIIDIGATLARFEDGERCIAPLEKIGYTYRGLSKRLHGHRHFVREHPTTHCPHLMEPSNEEWANLVLFRDYMIAHPDAAKEYAALKRALEAEFRGDGRRYRDGKDPFIEAVLEWAKVEFGYPPSARPDGIAAHRPSESPSGHKEPT